jgi:hypothetical protein
MLNNTAMSTTDQEELFKLLTEKALTDEHNAWEFIKNPTEWSLMRKTKAGLYKVIELYERVYKKVYQEYCKQVSKNVHDFTMLVALKQYQHCIDFYTQELATTLDMLEEYQAYLWQGHFFTQFVYQRDREVWHMWDHRQGDSHGN